MQVLKTHREECPTYGVSEIGMTFNGTENFCDLRGRELVGGGGGARPQRNFSNLKALKRHFQHSQADSCAKKVPIDLNFDKKSAVNSCIVFS